MALPLNPGANEAALPPTNVGWLPQEAPINLLGQRTNCYLLHSGTGSWIVDPPSPNAAELDEILAATPSTVAGILLTHTHPDHIGGVPALVQRTGVTVHAHPRAQSYLEAGLPFAPLLEGDSVDRWTVFEMPGHRFDSLCFFDPSTGCAIVGDLVAGAGSVIIDPSDGDLSEYLASLRRLRDELKPTLLAPGHGPLIDNPNLLLTHFINHRLAREQLVLGALAERPAPLQSLLPIAYADTPEVLYPLAERSLLAHLIKLEKEGRARVSDEGWRLTTGK